MMPTGKQAFDDIKRFYDEEYYAAAADGQALAPWHTRLIASRLGPLHGKAVLDVACGRGEWLAHLRSKGCRVAGIDLSDRAIEACRARMPEGEFACGPAESLPFGDGGFDLVSCLGSLEHFLDKPAALREMVRVAKPGAAFLILVPNAGFLTRRMGLYRGTHQAKVREDVLSLEQWTDLLRGAGLEVTARWRDLHMLNAAWIRQGGTPAARLLRAAQGLALIGWPIAWQYQVYHYCENWQADSGKSGR